MDTKKKKEELVNQFNQANNRIVEFSTLREQIRGKLMLLEEQEKEQKAKEKKDSKK